MRCDDEGEHEERRKQHRVFRVVKGHSKGCKRFKFLLAVPGLEKKLKTEFQYSNIEQYRTSVYCTVNAGRL